MGELISRHLGHIWIDLLPYEEAIEIAQRIHWANPKYITEKILQDFHSKIEKFKA
ncbi:MAG TPA: hypothetical protein VKX40_14550 [Aequorivita sp.]|jgi:hypothetical protein|nr:hypothetical protein [Aequorivita sp.]